MVVAGGAAVAAVEGGINALVLPGVLAAAALLLRYPVALLTLFLYVGLFKGEAAVQASPVDVTAALAALLVAVMAYRLFSGGVRRIPLAYAGPLLFLVALMALSLLWTPVGDYGQEKVLRFATLTMIAAISPFFVIRGERELISFLWAGALLAVVVAGLTVANPPSAATGRLQLGDSGTIFAGRLLCTGALILIVLPAVRRAGSGSRALAIGGALALLFVAAGIGSRGPVVAAGLALGCTVLAWSFREARQIAPVAVVVAAGLALFSLVELPDVAEQRLASAAADPVETLRADGRSALYRQAIDLTRQEPLLGIGAGGFRQYTGVVAIDAQRYPHNLFLEVSSEIGVPAMLLLIAVIGSAGAGLLRAAWVTERRELGVVLYLVAGLLLFHLFAVQFSGDVNDNKAFWTYLAIAWLALGIARDAPASRPNLDATSLARR